MATRKKRHLLRLVLKIRHLRPVHYVVLVLVIGIGVFNGITGLSPYIKQYQREKNIEKTFDRWWKDAGAQQFRDVGLEPTEKLRDEEFQSYREKYLSQNQPLIIEERVAIMKKEYREWWEYGGKDQFAAEKGFYPTEKEFNITQEQHIRKYTQQFLRYNMAFTPKVGNIENIATSWLLSPSVYSYIVFAIFFTFAIVQLDRRWNVFVILGTAAGALIVGGVLVDFMVSTSFFSPYVEDRYMGMSLPLMFLLGAAAFAPKRFELPQWVTGVGVAGLMLDMAANWFMNPGLYGAVTVLSPVLFGLGALAGLKIETRKKTKEELAAEALEERLRQNAERNPMAERKAKTRAAIEEGFRIAKEGLIEKSQRILQQAFNSLLQEHPVDTALVRSLAQRITSPSLYIDFSSYQWLEWGEIAKSKNAPEAAVLLLKKGLSLEKDPGFARRGLFILGEICVNNKIELQDGINRLKKVISMNETDMMAKQAKRMLDSIKAELPEEGAPAESDEG
ncbi:MAG: hypothetical protein HUK20_04025 [Fibrobacter sp.]|nr:hypothetical protein [Fibrobacter sp.]